MHTLGCVWHTHALHALNHAYDVTCAYTACVQASAHAFDCPHMHTQYVHAVRLQRHFTTRCSGYEMRGNITRGNIRNRTGNILNSLINGLLVFSLWVLLRKHNERRHTYVPSQLCSRCPAAPPDHGRPGAS